MSNYITKSAVLFLVFNRPDTTERVFETIRMAKPPRLYIASDGPRKHKVGEEEKVKTVRDIISNLDWECEVKTLYREENLGCGKAVSSAITWFFDHEEQGIILEDDCLPSSDFFRFCDEMLQLYKSNENIWVVTGNNFQNGIKRGDDSYYFSRYNHIWGWASWRRAWINYDFKIDFWIDWKNTPGFENYFNNNTEKNYWKSIFDNFLKGEIDTWDYQWTLCVFKFNGLTVTPNSNLVENIGFGKEATHTKKAINIDLSAYPIGEITHPTCIKRDILADDFTFNNLFNPSFPFHIKILNRLINFLKFQSS